MRMRHRQTLDARAHLNNGLLPIHMIRHADIPDEMTSEEATRNHFERIVFDWGCPGIRFNTPIESIVSHHLTWLTFLLTFRWFGVASDRPIFPVAQVNTDFIQVDADTRDMLKEPFFLGGKPGETGAELILPKVSRKLTFYLKLRTLWVIAILVPWKDRSWTCISRFSTAETEKEKGSSGSGTLSPWKINMEHNHRGLEDRFPF